MSKKTFILSDQTLNCYGFIVLTSGIDLGPFKANPVMLYNHINGNDPSDAIGKWDNIRVSDNKLMADADIDTEDEFALKVSKKVEKGYINGASIRFDFRAEDVLLSSPGFEGIPVIAKSVISETSICPIPGNSNALRLYADGELVKDNKLAAKLSNKEDNNLNTNNNTMKKILLFAAALGVTLKDDATEDHVLEAVKNLATERDNLKLKLKQFEDKEKEDKKNRVEALLSKGREKKIFAAGSEEEKHYRTLAEASIESTEALLDKAIPHKTLAEQLNGDAKGKEGEVKNPNEGKSYKELMRSKEGSQYLMKLKAENKDAYKKLWEADFPGRTFNG